MKNQLVEKLYGLGIKPSNFFFGLASVIAIILSMPSLRKYQDQMAVIRNEVADISGKSQKLERELEFEQSQAKVANERYKLCLPVVGKTFRNGTHYFTGLREGEIPQDRVTGQPLPTGTIVCDAHGTTAVINNQGQVTSTAYTGDRDLIQSRLKRFRYSMYSQPILNTGEQ